MLLSDCRRRILSATSAVRNRHDRIVDIPSRLTKKPFQTLSRFLATFIAERIRLLQRERRHLPPSRHRATGIVHAAT
jgi:hypothetical protein